MISAGTRNDREEDQEGNVIKLVNEQADKSDGYTDTVNEGILRRQGRKTR